MSSIRTNANIYWYNKDSNFGDQLNPYLLPKLFDINVKWVDSRHPGKKYFAIGSILGKADSQTIVWGSGLISDSIRISKKPIITAVRGPLTRNKLISQNITVPPIYGDPALLLPHVYSPKIKKKYSIGIIPHYVDKKSDFIKSSSHLKNVKIIDIQGKNIEALIDQIISCDIILSSSLHGLIVADAYQIPNIWIKISNGIIGGSFKFNDYFLSVGRSSRKPIIANSKLNIESLVNSYTSEEVLIDLSKLLKANPFK